MTGATQQAAERIRFALLGCGDVGARDAVAIGSAAGAELVACFDPVPGLAADIADRFGARTTSGVEQLLGLADVDAVIVATPHHTHELIAREVLAAGKHLLLEKPMAADLATAVRIADTADRSRLTAGVLFPMRSDPRFLQAREPIQSGLLGRPLGAVSSYLIDKPASYFTGGYSNRSPSTWRLSRTLSGGGFLIMNLIHHLDAVRALLGVEADEVLAATVPSVQAPQLDDVVTVLVRFGGALATFAGAGSAVRRSGEHLRLWGTDGNVDVLPKWRLSMRHSHSSAAAARGDPRAAAIAAFAGAVRTRSEPPATMADGLAVQAMVAAAYASDRSGTACRPATLLAEVRR